MVGRRDLAHQECRRTRRERNVDLARRTLNLDLADTLKRSEQQFQALANNIAQLAWMANFAGNLFWLNQRWLDYTGSTLETSGGQGWRLFHHPDHIARVVDK